MTIDPQRPPDEPEALIVVADDAEAVAADERGGHVRAYLELIRAPAVFTALADVMLGFFFAYREKLLDPQIPWTQLPLALLAVLLGASLCLYTAGMALNDFFDAQVDARERPRRPIPSGRIRRGTAGSLGAVLLLAGAGLGWAGSFYAGGLRIGLVASGLAAAVLLYDGFLKNTLIGPLGMGACRMLNVLLGMSAGLEAFSAVHYVLAGGVGLYIVGVTLFAQREAGRSNPTLLAAATAIMAAGIGLIGWFPNWADAAGISLALAEPFSQWQQFLGLIGALILYRCVMAIISGGQPAHVQRAVANCLRSLIVLDAFACYVVAGREPAIAIFCLLVPTLLLGRWLYST